LDAMYKSLAKLTAALKYEQVARSYLRTEIDLILALKEGLRRLDLFVEWFVAKIQSAQDLYENIVETSSLAKTLVEILGSITTKSMALIELNSSLYLSFATPEPENSLQISMRSANARQLFSISGIILTE
jgi:hypothetical protein